MSKGLKLGKISVTVFLTALIWVWADLAIDEQLELPGAVTITVAKASDPNLWVALETGASILRPSLTIDRVVLKGPASRIAEVSTVRPSLRNKGDLDLDLFLSPEQVGLSETTTRTFDTLTLLRASNAIRKLGLTVETCEPATLTVRVRRLRIESVPVECVDERGNSIPAATVEPPRVNMRVPPGEVSVAWIRLNAEEQRQAREKALEKVPYFDLADGQRREAVQKVKAKLPPAEDALRQYPVAATLGFCMSQNLQAKYKVELREDPTVAPVAPVLILATMAAHQEYDKMPFHMILYIEDSDKPGQEYISREMVFNFPEEYVRRGEIKLDGVAPKVQFRLLPIPTPTPIPEPSGM
jgi:hypothetical protein